MKRFMFLVLFVLVFRSNLDCQYPYQNWQGDWEQKDGYFIRKERNQKGFDIGEYLEKKCGVCGKPFNYTVTVDSNCKVTNDKTETYFGRNMHKDCYEKLITFLIWDYNKRKNEYESLFYLRCSTVGLSNYMIMVISTTINWGITPHPRNTPKY